MNAQLFYLGRHYWLQSEQVAFEKHCRIERGGQIVPVLLSTILIFSGIIMERLVCSFYCEKFIVRSGSLTTCCFHDIF